MAQPRVKVDDRMLYDNLAGLVRVLVVGPLAYGWLIVVLRITGKRALAQLNAFDFIVTVALGSTLATVVLTNSVAWTEGALALALLAVLQFAAGWASVHAGWVRRALTAEPTVLLRDGQVIEASLARERVSQQSLNQAVRGAGLGGLDQVAVVVLETNGKMSVVGKSGLGDRSALADLGG